MSADVNAALPGFFSLHHRKGKRFTRIEVPIRVVTAVADPVRLPFRKRIGHSAGSLNRPNSERAMQTGDFVMRSRTLLVVTGLSRRINRQEPMLDARATSCHAPSRQISSAT